MEKFYASEFIRLWMDPRSNAIILLHRGSTRSVKNHRGRSEILYYGASMATLRTRYKPDDGRGWRWAYNALSPLFRAANDA